MKVIITIDGRIVVDIDTQSMGEVPLPVLEVAEKPTPQTDEAQTTLDDHIPKKPDTTIGAIEASMSPSQRTRWDEAQEMCGDIRIDDIKPSGIKIIRCSICGQEGVNARSHPSHVPRNLEPRVFTGLQT